MTGQSTIYPEQVVLTGGGYQVRYSITEAPATEDRLAGGYEYQYVHIPASQRTAQALRLALIADGASAEIASAIVEAVGWPDEGTRFESVHTAFHAR